MYRTKIGMQVTTWLVFALSLTAAPLSSSPASASSFTPIYQFQGGGDGSGPGGLILGPGGELYGMTAGGGGGPCNGIFGCGTAFKLTPPKRPGGTWKETVIYAFQGGNDGSFPLGKLIWGEDGALYGATAWGGGSGCSDLNVTGCGTVFKLTPPHGIGGQWTETVLYRFQGETDGAGPNGVTLGNDGALYGSTAFGGNPSCILPFIPFPFPPGNQASCGTVFKLTPPIWTHGMWTESIVHVFEGGTDGGAPNSALTNRAGALYGVTQGTFSDNLGNNLACGTIFKLRPPNPPWVKGSYEVFGFFFPACDHGTPTSGVIVHRGAIYGEGDGDVYELTAPAKPGGMPTTISLYSFLNVNGGGSFPQGGLTVGRGGVFYGEATSGGTATSPDCQANGCGTIWRLAPPAKAGGAWTETVLHNFQGGADGSGPNSGLIEGADGALYGTVGDNSNGHVFRLVP
jgi:hypothetical protein